MWFWFIPKREAGRTLVPHTWNRWKRFWWAFRRAWRFAQGRYEIAEMTRQQERAFDHSMDKALESLLRTMQGRA